jgi:hypothetical protein
MLLGYSENDHGSMNLASKTAPLPATMPSSVAPKERGQAMLQEHEHLMDDYAAQARAREEREAAEDKERAMKEGRSIAAR